MGTGNSFPGTKAAGAWIWLLTFQPVQKLRISGDTNLPPRCIFMTYMATSLPSDSFCSLSYDKSAPSSKASSSPSAIWCFFQFPPSSLFLTDIQQLLSLLARLPLTSILPSIFPSITCSTRQFLRKMLPTQWVFIHFTVCRIVPFSLTACSTSSFLTRSDQPKFSIQVFLIYILCVYKNHMRRENKAGPKKHGKGSL
jgi:hypothetical protein